MRNAIDNPAKGETYSTINGIGLKTCGIKEAIEAVAEESVWADKDKGPKEAAPLLRGRHCGSTSYQGGARQLGHQSCGAIVSICEDGTVNLLTGATDCGQGSDTVLAMIAAESLGVRYEDVCMKRVDTAYTPVDPGSYGSRVTTLAGPGDPAGRARCQEATRRSRCEGLGSTSRRKSKSSNSVAYTKSNPDKKMSFEKVAKIASYEGSGAVILGRGYSGYGVEPLDFMTGTGNGGTSYSFTAQTTRVGVDMETGKVKVTDFTIGHDCGRTASPGERRRAERRRCSAGARPGHL